MTDREALAAKWRAEAANFDRGLGDNSRSGLLCRCADDLDAIPSIPDLRAIKLNAVMTALESLTARGVYLHDNAGNALNREQSLKAVTGALDAALSGGSK